MAKLVTLLVFGLLINAPIEKLAGEFGANFSAKKPLNFSYFNKLGTEESANLEDGFKFESDKLGYFVAQLYRFNSRKLKAYLPSDLYTSTQLSESLHCRGPPLQA